MARIAKKSFPRKCFHFDGADTSVTCPVVPSTTSFSVAFWISLDRVGSSFDRVVDWADGGPADGFDFELVNGSSVVRFLVRNGGSTTATLNSDALLLGKKYFFVATFESSGAGTATLFQDNVQKDQDTSVVMTAADATLTIGKRAGGSNFFRGKMGNFMFFNDKILDQTEMDNLYYFGTVPTGCTVWYDFDNDVVDISGNGNDGTGANTEYELFTNPVRSLGIGSTQALSFTPTNSIVTINDTADLRIELTEEFTWFNRVWIEKHDTNVLPRILEKTPHYSCWMGDKTNGRYRSFAVEYGDNSGAVEYWGKTRLEPYVWYDIASVGFASGASVVHYVNSVLEDMVVLAGPLDPPMDSSSGNQLKLGNSNGLDRNPGAYLKDMRQHNVALTQAEVTQLFNGTEVTRGLVGKWDMSEGSGATVADSSGNNYHGHIANASWVTTNISTRTAVSSRELAGNRTPV